jgi:hypothetical protein
MIWLILVDLHWSILRLVAYSIDKKAQCAKDRPELSSVMGMQLMKLYLP